MASESEKSEAMQFLSSTFNVKELFKVGTWVNILKGSYKHSIGYVWRVRTHGLLHVLTEQKRLATPIVKRPDKSISSTEKCNSNRTTANTHSPLPYGFQTSTPFPTAFRIIKLNAPFDVSHARPDLNSTLHFYYAGVNIEPLANQQLTQIADTVLIKTGEFISKRAVVRRLSKAGVEVLVSDPVPDNNQWQTFLAYDEFQRVYLQGQHVKVEAGAHYGKEGIILDIDNDDALVLCEKASSEVSFQPLSSL